MGVRLSMGVNLPPGMATWLGLSYPSAIVEAMESTSVRFAGAARDLGRAARLRDLVAPSFKSPPRLDGYSRTIRRRAAGNTVSIVLRDRPWPAVIADMIEGIVVSNSLTGARADQIRAALWLAVEVPLTDAA